MLTNEEAKKISDNMRALLAAVLLSPEPAVNVETAAVRAGLPLAVARHAMLLLLTARYVHRVKDGPRVLYGAENRPEVFSTVADHVARVYMRMTHPGEAAQRDHATHV